MKQLVGLLAYGLIAFFLYSYLKNIDLSAIAKADINYIYLVPAVISVMGSRLILPFVWISLLRNFEDIEIRYKELFAIYARSWMFRYIPGKIALIGTKIVWATQYGVRKATAVVASFLENILQVFGSALTSVVFFPFLYASKQVEPQLLVGTLIVVFLMLVALIPPVFNRLTALAYRILKKEELDPSLSLTFRVLSRTTCIVFLAKFVSGLATAFLTLSVKGDITLADFCGLVGISALSGAVGMAAFFAPGGLGVTDSVQIVLIASIVGKELALVVVMTWRILAVICDVLFYLIFGRAKQVDSSN